LHGITAGEPPETQVAWRQEVEELRLTFEEDDTDRNRQKKRKVFEQFAAELLEDYPLKPLELPREPSYRAFKHRAAMAERDPGRPVWLLDSDGAVQVLTLGDMGDKNNKDRIEGMTVLLPRSAGGLSGGQLDGSTRYDAGRKDYDVADLWKGPNGEEMRRRTKSDVATGRGWRLVRSIEIGETADGDPREVWRWMVRQAATDEAGAVGQFQPYPLDAHNADARQFAAEMVKRPNLPDDLASSVTVAAGTHDLGKDREV
jgi:CRISPR-associated endonuclease/helicase Cas3